ncbi:MAG: hypothetical protein LBT25_03825 [Candidatus Symbiothrix sp.]|nr:hypothetical protein [Candidatus Symbiothrix sp.]
MVQTVVPATGGVAFFVQQEFQVSVFINPIGTFRLLATVRCIVCSFVSMAS